MLRVILHKVHVCSPLESTGIHSGVLQLPETAFPGGVFCAPETLESQDTKKACYSWCAITLVHRFLPPH